MLPLLIYFLFGLIIGSFLNVCIYRLPRRESIVMPGSHCPACGHPVRPIDNIPVLSYVLLLGRCRDCGTHISLQYPAVELLAGASFLFCARKWQFSPATFTNSLLMALLIALVFIDYQHQILPNVLTLPGALAGILLSPLQASSFYDDVVTYYFAAAIAPDHAARALPWTGAVFGALFGGGTLLIVSLLYRFARKKQGLGMGDIKMMAMAGAFLGWRMALLTIFLGSFMGSILGLFLVLFRGKNLQHKMAFGTFLGVAAAISLFFGLPLIRWYVSLNS